MTIKLDNNNNLPGTLGGALAPLVVALALASGYTLYPGMAAYYHNLNGKVIGPPRNNKTTITFSAAPSSGDTLTATINGESISQAWDTDAATTMAAFAVKAANVTGVASATVGGSNTTITLIADAGAECIVTAVANSDGTTTDTITPETTDVFCGVVTRQRSEGTNGVMAYTYPCMVPVLVDGDSVRCGIGGKSGDTYNISTAPYVRLNAGNTAIGEYPGQIMASAAIASGRAFGQLQSELSFDGSGALNTYNYVAVTKGA